MPVIRPLWFEFPTDKQTYLTSDEYLLGRDVLVAPVVKDGLREREVYFPAGQSWTDWWTGDVYEGGKSATVKALLEHLPFFIRVGAVIPVEPVIQNTGEMSVAPVTLLIGAGMPSGKTEISALFQDAGDGYGYRSTDWREFRFEQTSGATKISRIGNFNGQPIRSVEVLGLDVAPRELLADSKRVHFNYDAKTKRLTADIPENTTEVRLIQR
jgi:alpha-glucosidase